MAEMADIGVHHLLPLHGGCLKGNQLIAVVEGGNHACGDELEDNGVSRVLPAENGAVKAVHNSISKKHIGPDGVPGAVGYKQGYKVRASGGRVSPESNDDCTSKDDAAKNNIQHLICKDGAEVEYLQKNTA